jgi:hypothetical protein
VVRGIDLTQQVLSKVELNVQEPSIVGESPTTKLKIFKELETC